MAGLTIELQKCVGCGLCVKSCAVGALTVRKKKAAVDPALCTLCGVCVDSCRPGALTIKKEEKNGADLSLCSGVWVFAEPRDGRPLSVAYELLGKGRELADAKGCRLTALLFGGHTTGAQELIAAGADEVLLCEDVRLGETLEEPYCALLASLVTKRRPDILLFGATGFGRSLAPRLAARVRTGLTADCTSLAIDPETGLLRQTRPAFGGNLCATIICPSHRPQMATVRPGVMAAPTPDYHRTGVVVPVSLPALAAPSVELLEAVGTGPAETIADAQVIVSAGRGIGSRKNLSFVYELAELLGGSVGVSRPLVDIGWSEYKHQIGQTGCAVAPKLLIACGVSGAIQHLAGIAGAQTIIAVNADPDAPIFSVAHYKVVGDCVEVLKELIAAVKRDR